MKGKISFSGMKPKHSVERVLEREMERWLAQEERPNAPEPSHYQVRITSESEAPFYYCRVDAEVDGCRWIANESGKTPELALRNSLKRMRVSRVQNNSNYLTSLTA